jgi:tellurite resistance protein TehA-like permease
MDALSIILFLIMSIFTIYVVYYFSNKEFPNYNLLPNDVCNASKFEAFTNPLQIDSKNIYSYNFLDPFGLINGSMECSGSGYTNLNGNICLNNEQKELLITRGKNATDN